MGRRFHWQTPVVTLIFILAIAFLGYQGYSVVTKEVPTQGGTYVEGVVGNPMAINPLLAQFNDADKDLVALIFSGLTKLGKGGEVLPDLAESWEISPDGRSYTFRLRQEARWHDGKPVTAEDILFTVNMVKSKDFPGSPDLSALWKNVKSEKIDDYTVKFTLEEPFSPFLSYTTLGAVPAHLLKGIPPKALSEATFNANPVGSGPFNIQEASLERVVLKSSPTYYLGSPNLAQMELRFFHDEEAALAALTTKKVQGTLFRPVLRRESIEKLRKNSRLNLYSAPRSGYSAIFLNWKSPLFQDRAVRQALLYAIDREKIVKDIAVGQGEIANSPIVSGTWAYNPNVKGYSYDPEKAARLLKEAGWKMNGQGVLEKEGKEFRFQLMTNTDPIRVAIGEETVRELRRLGVRAELSSSGSAGLMQNFLIPRNFDAILYGLDVGYDPDSYPTWHSSQGNREGLNVSSFANEKVDKLLETARLTPELAERRASYYEFQTAFAEAVPSLLLYYPSYNYAVDKKVKGIKLGVFFETSSRFSNVKDWYMFSKRVPRQ